MQVQMNVIVPVPFDIRQYRKLTYASGFWN